MSPANPFNPVAKAEPCPDPGRGEKPLSTSAMAAPEGGESQAPARATCLFFQPARPWLPAPAFPPPPPGPSFYLRLDQTGVPH